MRCGKKRFGTILGAGLAALVAAMGSAAEVPISGFSQVTPFLYRGARPTEAGMGALRDLQIKTVLNLETDGQAISQEREWAKARGIRFVSVPVTGLSTPSDRTIASIFNVIRDPSQQPVFLHCKHGKDRTGVVVSLFRFWDQHWSAKKAYDEMLSLGFHTTLVSLDSFYRKQTGMKISAEEVKNGN